MVFSVLVASNSILSTTIGITMSAVYFDTSEMNFELTLALMIYVISYIVSENVF